MTHDEQMLALLKENNSLLSEQIALMQGHRCQRCGAMGALGGNPPYCYACKP